MDGVDYVAEDVAGEAAVGGVLGTDGGWGAGGFVGGAAAAGRWVGAGGTGGA